MAGKCMKCCMEIENRQFLTCSKCTRTYHVDCTANVSLKRFYLMDRKKRENWTCFSCNSKSRLILDPSTPVHMNVTQRKKIKINIPIENSFSSLDSNDDLDVGENSVIINRSCPDMDYNDREKLDDLKAEIRDLREKLAIAENEIENILSENGMLKKENIEYQSKICKLNSICRSTTRSFSRSGKKMRSSRRKTLECGGNRTPEMNNSFEALNVEQHEYFTPSSEVTHIRSPHLEVNVEVKQHGEISPIVKDTALNHRLHRRLLVLSNNNKNKISSSLQRYFSHLDYCHYVMPGGGVKNLLADFDMKTKGMTLNDYCVILIGDIDAANHVDHIDTIKYIRETLINVTYTNVILAVPTYRTGHLIFNYKVENFVNLLHRDITNEGYAYFFDSNLNLQLNMFSVWSGRINNLGMKSTMSDLCDFIHALINGQAVYNDKSETSFFRD